MGCDNESADALMGQRGVGPLNSGVVLDPVPQPLHQFLRRHGDTRTRASFRRRIKS